MLTYTQIVEKISLYLQDVTPTDFPLTNIYDLLDESLVEISDQKPRVVTLPLTADGTFELELTDECLRNLIGVKKAEYPIDETPREFRDVNQEGNIVTIVKRYPPTDGDTVNLYLNKKHRLGLLGTTDTEGQIKTAAEAGATSLALKTLGTGTINEDSTLTIAGDETEYTVIATVTIATAEATVSIYPELAEDADEDAVVILAAPVSSLDITLERILIHLTAGKLAISKARDLMNQVNLGGGGGLAPRELLVWGTNEITTARDDLKRYVGPRISRRYPID